MKDKEKILPAFEEPKVKSISDRKRQANRRNSLRSTGPRTVRGKSTSRKNSLRHALLARAIPLRSLPFLDSRKEEQDLENLLSDLHAELRPEGRVEEMLVERIACLYFQLSRLYRYQTALTTIAMQNELGNATVELGDTGTQIRVAITVREKLAGLLERSKQEAPSDQSFSSELLCDIDAVIMSPERAFILRYIHEEIRRLMTATDWRDNQSRISQLKSRFLNILELAVRESRTLVESVRPWVDELAKARFDQHLLPDEAVLRKLQRYESMIDREFYRALGKIEQLQRGRAGDAISPFPNLTMQC